MTFEEYKDEIEKRLAPYGLALASYTASGEDWLRRCWEEDCGDVVRAVGMILKFCPWLPDDPVDGSAGE